MKVRHTKRHRQHGFTLIEVMLVAMSMSVVLGMMYAIAAGMTTTAKTQDASIMLKQEARLAMQSIVQNLRMARGNSIQTNAGGGPVALGNNPVTNIIFQRVIDQDGNGVALNTNLTLGVTPPLMYAVDTNDANGDNRNITQLVQLRQDGSVARVLANHISPVALMAQAGNPYNAPAGGLIFQDIGAGSIQVTLIMRYQPDPTGPVVVARLDEVVTPRN